MIFDHLENWKHLQLKSSEALEQAFELVSQLTPDSEIGEYPLQGESMFARVLEYETKPAQEAICESHRKYVDLQATLKGSEDIEWYYAPDLKVEKPYDEAKDATFYTKGVQPILRLTNTPGFFTLLFPSDAHSPGITSIESEGLQVKKVVVKIHVDLFSALPGISS